MPLPSMTAVGNLKEILGDIGASELLETAMTRAQVQFVSNFPAEGWMSWDGTLWRVKTTVDAIVNNNGDIVKDDDDTPVLLLANDDGLNVRGLQWQLRVTLPSSVIPPITGSSMRAFWFNAAEDGESVFLDAVLPVVANPVHGVTPGDGLTMGMVNAAIDAAVLDLIGDAEEGLNTLGEIADALDDDEDFAGSMVSLLSGKVATTRAVATQYSLTGGGNLTVDRTLNLVGDTANPGNSKLYGTDGSGTRGWYNIPTPGGGGITEVADDTSPTLGGNLTMGSFTIGGADSADFAKLAGITLSAAEINALSAAAIDAIVKAAATVISANAHGADPDNEPEDNDIAFAAAFEEAEMTKSVVWCDIGTYEVSVPIAVPKGITFVCAGQFATRFYTAEAISVVIVGAQITAEGDRYGTVGGFTIDGDGVATLGLEVAATCVQRQFIGIEVENVAGPAYRLDATQNSTFLDCDSIDCTIGWRVLNDAASNSFEGCEVSGCTTTGILMENDASLPGSELGADEDGLMGGAGPSNNTWIKCLTERGTMTNALKLVRGRRNRFIGCDFVSYGNTAMVRHVDLQTNAGQNTFWGCIFAGSADTGYEAFEYALHNAGSRNRLESCDFEIAALASGYIIGTSNALFIDAHCTFADTYQIEYTGGGDSRRSGALIDVPLDKRVGTTAQRPNFGPATTPFPYLNLDLVPPRYELWDGNSWEDPLATMTAGDSAETASALMRRDLSANVWVNDLFVGTSFFTTGGATNVTTISSNGRAHYTISTTAAAHRLPTTSVHAGFSRKVYNSPLSTVDVIVQSSDTDVIIRVAPGCSAIFTAKQATPTDATHWDYEYFGARVASAKVFNVSNSLTFAGTDGTTHTTPAVSSHTVAGSIDGANASVHVAILDQTAFDAIVTPDDSTVYVIRP